MLKKKISFLVLLIMSLGLTFMMKSCDDDQEVVVIPIFSVYDVIKDSKDHTILLEAIKAAGLEDALKRPRAYLTVFAPTDSAFMKLPEGTLDDLLANPIDLLKPILLYHVTDEVLKSSQLRDGMILGMLDDLKAKITVAGNQIKINSAVVNAADLMAENGVVHSINEVLIPPAVNVFQIVEQSVDHATLEIAIVAAGLQNVLSDLDEEFTLFAPTDEAFNALPEGALDDLLANPTALRNILLYHTLGDDEFSSQLRNSLVETLNGEDIVVRVEGGRVFINQSEVIIADILATNGVVHVINAVLIPPAD